MTRRQLAAVVLIREPGGFEGFRAWPEPAPNFDELSSLLIKLDAARKPEPKATQAEHLIA